MVVERRCKRCGIPESEHELSFAHFFVRSENIQFRGENNVELPQKGTKGMIIVQLPDKRIGIRFRHMHTGAIVHGVNKKVRLTHCSIYDITDDPEDPHKLAYGVAKCSDNDQFVKEKGRKVSLTRALLSGDTELSAEGAKAIRTIIWETYRNRGKVSFVPPTDEGAPAIEGLVINEQKLIPALLEEVPAVTH